jgi:uncharacterized protein with HEPN domain
MIDKGISSLKHIVKYCTQIDETLNHFDNSYDSFTNKYYFQYIISFCLAQIGELVGRCPKEIKDQIATISPVRPLVDLRNLGI